LVAVTAISAPETASSAVDATSIATYKEGPNASAKAFAHPERD
jgi:hypothetical protein